MIDKISLPRGEPTLYVFAACRFWSVAMKEVDYESASFFLFYYENGYEINALRRSLTRGAFIMKFSTFSIIAALFIANFSLAVGAPDCPEKNITVNSWFG